MQKSSINNRINNPNRMIGAELSEAAVGFPNPIGDLISNMIENMAEANRESYYVFDGVMKHHGYAWEAVKVPTEDGFTLTTFHVTGKIAEDGSVITREPTEPPVLVQHGLGSDAATWLWSYIKGNPLPLTLYD